MTLMTTIEPSAAATPIRALPGGERLGAVQLPGEPEAAAFDGFSVRG